MSNMQLLTIAVLATMLVTSAVMAAESVSATKYKGKNQALSQANACGNGKLPLNVLCSNVGSQVQGEDNAVSLAGAQQAGDFDHGKKKDHDKDKDKDWDNGPKNGNGHSNGGGPRE
jgi:hypothetical protein